MSEHSSAPTPVQEGLAAGASEAGSGARTAPSSPPEQKNRRRPHTKSRTGCITCKKRRVKCDETRPTCRNCVHLRLPCKYLTPVSPPAVSTNMHDLRLLYTFITEVAPSVAAAGISNHEIWCKDVPELSLRYPFLMHAVLMFSASLLNQREPKVHENAVVQHRSEALRLLRHEVQNVCAENLDALVAASVVMILDAMANAAQACEMTLCSLPPATWLHHVRGAATIVLAVGMLPPTSKFYAFMGIDLLDLANMHIFAAQEGFAPLRCLSGELAELYPVRYSSPYFPSLAYLEKLHTQRDRSDYILRVFAFPALMDGGLVALLNKDDKWANQIIQVWYKFVRSYISQFKDKIWFLRGVSRVLPIDQDAKFGGFGFVHSALPVSQTIENILARFDENFFGNEDPDALLSSMIDLEPEDPALEELRQLEMQDLSLDLELKTEEGSTKLPRW